MQEDLPLSVVRHLFCRATPDPVSAGRAVGQHFFPIRKKAKGFQQEQASIDQRLLVTTQSETSDEAAQTFEASMGRLKKLEVAAGYVELLKEVDALR